MIQRRIAISVVVLSALVFALLMIAYANISYPLVGHDFSYGIPRLIDPYLHFKLNGLSIEWYTPTFGGGLPAYPNPQDLQFTLPALYMSFLNPWSASLLANATFILIGCLSAYYFLESSLKFSPLAAALGSIFFNVNGFVFVHDIMGQVGFQALPLLPLLLIAFTDARLRPLLRGILAASVLAILVYSAGFNTAVIFALSLSMAIPLLMLIRPNLFNGTRPATTLLWAGLFTSLLTGSKLYAVLSFMQQFPRLIQDHYATGLLHGLYGTFLQLVQTTTIFPILNWPATKVVNNLAHYNLSHYIGYIHAVTGTDYGIWEFDSSVSPAILLLLIAGLVLWIRDLRSFGLRIGRSQVLMGTLLLAAVWITTEFRLTTGLIYPEFQTLPILKSLHVNLRYTAAYILPLSLAGALIFERLQLLAPTRLRFAGFSLLAAITLLVPVSYFAIPASNFEYFYNIQPALDSFDHIQRGETYPIRQLVLNDDFYNLDPLLQNASDLNPYEALFGYKLEAFHPQTHVGPVTEQTDGYFNMTNPASLVYPRENNLSPFERIAVADRKNFEALINHGQPDWKLPWIQHVLDWLTALSACAVLLISAVYLALFLLSKFRTGGSHG